MNDYLPIWAKVGLWVYLTPETHGYTFHNRCEFATQNGKMIIGKVISVDQNIIAVAIYDGEAPIGCSNYWFKYRGTNWLDSDVKIIDS